MGLLRIVIQKPEGKPFSGLGVTLRRTEPAEQATTVRQGTTDDEGVVRFYEDAGTFKVEFSQLPEGVNPPKYGTSLRLEDYAEGLEQIIRLVEVSQ